MRLTGCAFLFIFTIAVATSFGQIQAPSAIYSEMTNYASPDPVYFFSTVQMQVLTCQGPNPSDTYTFNWTRHNPTGNTWNQPLQSQVGASSELMINEPGGYQVRVTGPGVDVIYRCWAFEPMLNNTSIDEVDATCFYLDLRANNDTLPLVYYNPSTSMETRVRYNRTYQWTASTGGTLPQGAFISMNAPVENTRFEVLVTDKFGNQSMAYLDYTAIAVEAKYKREIVKLNVPQEIHSEAEGSAPIEVRFQDESKGNITAWEWRFGRAGVAFDRNPFYVFTAFGKDTVTLRVINRLSGCESISEDNLIVNVINSLLEVPNTFTPNGDGANDEFRVVYSSIKKYHIVVFNRWGRKVYESTNPAEGWDGTVGGSMAPPGVYFYYIEAEGYEKGEKHKLHGPIHLIRGK